jgi:SNF family Na+-dependent transporter
MMTAFVALNLLLAGSVFFPATASAATEAQCSGSGNTFLGFPTWYKYLDHSWEGGDLGCDIRFSVTSTRDIGRVMLAIFEIVLRIAGIVTVVFIVYGGFQYLIARGEADRAKAARTTIMNALIGLVIALFASAAVNLIAGNL